MAAKNSFYFQAAWLQMGQGAIAVLLSVMYLSSYLEITDELHVSLSPKTHFIVAATEKLVVQTVSYNLPQLPLNQNDSVILRQGAASVWNIL